MRAQPDGVAAQRRQEDGLQLGAMHDHAHDADSLPQVLGGDLDERAPIPRSQACRLVGIARGFHGCPGADFVQRVQRVRPQRNPRTYFAQLAGAFEDGHVEAGPAQRDTGRQAANACTDDNCLHGTRHPGHVNTSACVTIGAEGVGETPSLFRGGNR